MERTQVAHTAKFQPYGKRMNTAWDTATFYTLMCCLKYCNTTDKFNNLGKKLRLDCANSVVLRKRTWEILSVKTWQHHMATLPTRLRIGLRLCLKCFKLFSQHDNLINKLSYQTKLWQSNTFKGFFWRLIDLSDVYYCTSTYKYYKLYSRSHHNYNLLYSQTLTHQHILLQYKEIKFTNKTEKSQGKNIKDISTNTYMYSGWFGHRKGQNRNHACH